MISDCLSVYRTLYCLFLYYLKKYFFLYKIAAYASNTLCILYTRKILLSVNEFQCSIFVLSSCFCHRPRILIRYFGVFGVVSRPDIFPHREERFFAGSEPDVFPFSHKIRKDSFMESNRYFHFSHKIRKDSLLGADQIGFFSHKNKIFDKSGLDFSLSHKIRKDALLGI